MNLANNHADDFGAGRPALDRARAAQGGRALDGPARADHDPAPQRAAHRAARLRALQVGRRLEQIARRRRRSCARPRREADLVVVAMHAGRRGLGRDARPARHRDVPGREPRRLAPLRARRDRRRRRPRRRLGAARDPRRRALPRAPDRVLARQLRRLQELRHGRHALAERDPDACSCAATAVRRRHAGSRCASTATRCRTPIRANASARLVAQLSREDFGAAAAADRRRTGRSGS